MQPPKLYCWNGATWQLVNDPYGDAVIMRALLREIKVCTCIVKGRYGT